MRLAIFGATGATGRHLVEQALQAGHEVRALTRSPQALPLRDPRLQVIAGSLDDEAALRSTLSGADAVISVLGARRGDAAPVCTDGMRSILPAMQAAGVRRLVALSAYGAAETRDASLFIRFVRKVIAAKMRDKDGMEALVRASGADWTLVRPPALTNGKPGGVWRAGATLRPGWSGRLARADLAAFMLREAERGAYIGAAPVVSV
ncbi:NAD(P)-dependent oxidoreductase [Duganella sp. HH105]|uniref:NAD(P)-dependent oxidoreductase n=1 Tax=Duganella sp. HH105 TaxID=1781067 RepID=UPI000877B6A2|nr:SDR family oxidoreductase [Duganella sp. HH105]OEZ55437.1 3 beta-hydroxysteroid dehydrogenase/delta 5-->4-isomerase [Duganella sp. HH105]